MDELHEAYDVDVAKLNRLAARSAERAEALKAENAKLREQVAWLKQGDVLHVLTDQELEDKLDEKRCMQASINALDAENAKLRELIADVHEALKADRAGMFHRLTLASMEDDMRELGIEVRGK